MLNVISATINKDDYTYPIVHRTVNSMSMNKVLSDTLRRLMGKSLKWMCMNCKYSTDNFDEVWDHARGASHQMKMVKRRNGL